MLVRLAHRIVLSAGWRRAAIAVLAGALSTLALAPFDAWPVLFVTFPVAVWLLDGAAGGRLGATATAALIGWCFGFGYFLAGLYWIGYAFLVDAKTFGWLLPFAVTALPAGLAIFTAFGFAAARLMWTRGAARIVALAVALTAAEWLRGHLFSGFPWNALGYALTGPLVLAQASALVGLWGLTLFAVLLFASPAVLADERVDTPRPLVLPVGALAALAALALYGAIRLAQTPTGFVAGVKLRIMQPNLPQDEKFNYAAKERVMDRYIALSDRAAGPELTGVRDVTHLIWPESAFPFFLTREPDALARIAAMLRPATVLITGAVRAPDVAPNAATLRAYNAIYVIGPDGSVLSVYDKLHLVPFGEYLPFQSLLESLGFMQLTKVAGGFIPGERRRPITVPRAPAMLPLICYEVIFPGAAVPRGEQAGWILNVTNDAWFGISTGPYQHLQQTRVRAIEEGMPVVRAANNGVSAVIDPVGRLIKTLPLGTDGVLDSGLPQRIDATPYGRTGDAPAGLLWLAALAVALRRRLRS